MKWDDSEYRGLTSRIIKQFYVVHDLIGCGFVERVYQNALEI